MATANNWRYWEFATDEEVGRTFSNADSLHRRGMARASRELLKAQNGVWPCGHLRNGNTHRIGNAVMCKVCRRRRWREGAKRRLANDVRAMIAQRFDLEPEDFFVGARPSRSARNARATYAQLLSGMGLPPTEIAPLAGWAHQTSAIYAIDMFAQYAEHDERMAAALDEARQFVGGAA